MKENIECKVFLFFLLWHIVGFLFGYFRISKKIGVDKHNTLMLQCHCNQNSLHTNIKWRIIYYETQ